jgi:mannose-1-phosphate guanylyltransferase/mannose-6-phosphate isomerase
MFTDVLILAGGFGERLWPASTTKTPKQFLSIDGEVSFFQSSVLRAFSLQISGKILIITREDILKTCIAQCLSLSKLFSDQKLFTSLLKKIHIICEPKAMGTAAAILLGSFYLKQSDAKNHAILSLTSDHIISPFEAFKNDVAIAYNETKENKLVCFGISPSFPSTSYGYIQVGEKTKQHAYELLHFKEKPDAKLAQSYFETKEYLWNSGMFAFTSEFMLKAFNTHQHSYYAAFEKLKNTSWYEQTEENNIEIIKPLSPLIDVYNSLSPIAIDVAIAEKIKERSLVKASFIWDDIGTWDSYASLFDQHQGLVFEYESKNNFVYSDLPVSLCYVDNLIVVVKNNRVLVLQKGKSQYLKEITKLQDTNQT